MLKRAGARAALACGIAGLLVAASAAAQQPTVTPVAARTPGAAHCTAAEYRQLDFWLGDWEVETVAGEHAGVNHITSVLGGCAIQEEWVGASGVRGMSINSYSITSKLWHQTWVDDQGNLLQLAGAVDGGKLVLHGAAGDPTGERALHRLTYEPLNDGAGTIRQTWQTSADGGTTWRTMFDLKYHRRDARAPVVP